MRYVVALGLFMVGMMVVLGLGHLAGFVPVVVGLALWHIDL